MTDQLKVDENKFFRESTMRICGNLEIDKALQDCLHYIRDYIPADFMGFVIYLPEEKSYETIAVAHLTGSDTLPVKVPAMEREVKKLSVDFTKPRVTIFNQPSEITQRQFPSTFNWPEGPTMVIEMVLSGKRMGALIIINEQNQNYSKYHARLLSLLNEPLGIALTNSIRYRRVNQLKNILADDKRYLQNELLNLTEHEIIGERQGLKKIMKSVYQVAPMNSPVLLLGETGVGKEVIANAIHQLSPRCDAPFIKVNCGAISDQLVDSELFGHEKGAFTGAIARKRGRFERAHGGTIFLDEIGELPLEAQVRLLRVLQDKQLERVGGEESIPVDCRIITATHRDLPNMIDNGKFRKDLYFRLKIFPIMIPSLRKRKVDIPLLVQHFIRKKTRELALSQLPSLSPEALPRLMAYEWPGNVRELENAVERALIVSQGMPLNFEDLGGFHAKEIGTTIKNHDESFTSLEDIIKRQIIKAMEAARGRVEGKKGAAELLAIHPGTLRQKMRKLDIPFGRNALHLYNNES
ncbi:MAG: sigma-54 dependent transcriptional regulator [Proteobacteria bacterium]|nr:sigma-54 dependent transcriptional regulator [Pseudomonadota bacterium]